MLPVILRSLLVDGPDTGLLRMGLDHCPPRQMGAGLAERGDGEGGGEPGASRQVKTAQRRSHDAGDHGVARAHGAARNLGGNRQERGVRLDKEDALRGSSAETATSAVNASSSPLIRSWGALYIESPDGALEAVPDGTTVRPGWRLS